jgi:2-methylcitrate dehydratase PrpD/predicted RNA-binding protein with PIN domain
LSARWIVDGMNVIGSRPTGWWRDRPRAMRELVDELRVLGEPVTVVFDGEPFELGNDAVDVRFATRRGRNAADDDIAAIVAQATDPVRVVTSDAELAERVREHGAEVVGAGSFRARLEAGAGAAAGSATSTAPSGKEASLTTATGSPYALAFVDWLACAARGRAEPAARATEQLGEPVVHAGTAGHVLDFDDTYLPGIAHLSAPVAPVALVLGAELGRPAGEVLEAYAEGFEAMGAIARASHPALYDGGWHPTAVCGGAGAAVAAARLLRAERDSAVAVALLRASGLLAAFGSHGKSLQVGLAASTGLQAARLAAAGARVPLAEAARGFEEATGGRYAAPGDELAIRENWIKAWPCCLQTHGAIEAASRARESGAIEAALTVTVHPVSLQAAAYGPRPEDGLQAKFSIPYLTAFTLLHGPPSVESFDRVDQDACALAERIEVRTDRGLLESECVLEVDGDDVARVEAALGSPQRPMDAEALREKVVGLAGEGLADALDDLDRPAAELLELAGLGRPQMHS